MWGLLERVGLVRSGPRRRVGLLDTLGDPAATDALATALADRLQAQRPDLVVAWEGLHTAILGYAVGLRLGVPVLIVSDDEGLVTASRAAPTGARAALVAPVTPDEATARMVSGYLESHGVRLIAQATLLATGGVAGGSAPRSAFWLAELPPERDEAAVLSPGPGDEGGR